MYTVSMRYSIVERCYEELGLSLLLSIYLQDRK